MLYAVNAQGGVSLIALANCDVNVFFVMEECEMSNKLRSVEKFGFVLLCFGVVLVCGQISQANETVVTQVILEQTQGVTANYDSVTGTVHFEGGSAGFIMFSDFSTLSFSNAYVLAEAWNAEDSSSGGWAQAVFTGGGLFSVTLNEADLTGASFSIIGNISAYHETETGLGDEIDGAGVLPSVTVTFGTGWYGSGTFTELQWGAAGAMLDVDTALPAETGFGSYNEDYSTQNSIITLMVPEPATIFLLGVSGLALLRRRK